MKKEMQARWDTHAVNYDTSAHHGMRDPKEEAFWENVFLPHAGETLLDVGCGTGFVTMVAARSGLCVTGADWSEGMMEKARAKVAEEGFSVEFVQSDIEALPFENDSFSVVSARHVMWTLQDPNRAFREWCRVLKPGGVLFADYSPRKGAPHAAHYRLEVEQQLPLNRDVSNEEITRMLLDAGFSDVKITEREAWTHDHHGKEQHGDPHHGMHGGRFFFACTK
jgi:ubiquinone/menaquinone biosynthesis C-methylase UbiE